MAQAKEYIACRYDRGTKDKLLRLRDFIGAKHTKRPAAADDVDKSEVMREVMNFGLDVFERRAEAWRAEQPSDESIS